MNVMASHITGNSIVCSMACVIGWSEYRLGARATGENYQGPANGPERLFLTHLPLNKMAVILANDIFRSIFLIKIYAFQLKFHWSLLLRV